MLKNIAKNRANNKRKFLITYNVDGLKINKRQIIGISHIKNLKICHKNTKESKDKFEKVKNIKKEAIKPKSTMY